MKFSEFGRSLITYQSSQSLLCDCGEWRSNARRTGESQSKAWSVRLKLHQTETDEEHSRLHLGGLDWRHAHHTDHCCRSLAYLIFLSSLAVASCGRNRSSASYFL